MKTYFDTNIVDSSYLLEHCTPEERLTLVYAHLFGGYTGIRKYALPIEATRIGIPVKRLEEILEKFSEAGALYYCDGYIMIPGYTRELEFVSKKGRANVKKQISFLPQNVKDEFQYEITYIMKQYGIEV